MTSLIGDLQFVERFYLIQIQLLVGVALILISYNLRG